MALNPTPQNPSKPMNPALTRLTQTIIGCRQCLDNPLLFDWAPPRGWAGEGAKEADIIIVALNPGHPMTDPVRPENNECPWYDSLGINKGNTSVTAQQALHVRDFCLDQYKNPGSSGNWTFHRNSVGLARALLWFIDGQDPLNSASSIWQRIWFTDVFKCSTEKESSPKITKCAVEKCLPYLKEEIDILKPKLVVALGGRSAAALRDNGIVHVKFRHPSRGRPKLNDQSHDFAFAQAAEILLGRPLTPADLKNLCNIRKNC